MSTIAERIDPEIVASLHRGRRCPEKVRYDGLIPALDKLLTYSRIYGDASRAYKCPHCDGWHLTSQPRREDRLKGEQRLARRVLWGCSSCDRS